MARSDPVWLVMSMMLSAVGARMVSAKAGVPTMKNGGTRKTVLPVSMAIQSSEREVVHSEPRPTLFGVGQEVVEEYIQGNTPIVIESFASGRLDSLDARLRLARS